MAIKEMLRCGICRQRAEADAMHFDSSKQVNVCPSCYAKKKTSGKARIDSQIASRAIQKEINPEDNKTRYKCESCTYLFTRGHSYDGKICPYCGKRGTVHIRGDTGAENI